MSANIEPGDLLAYTQGCYNCTFVWSGNSELDGTEVLIMKAAQLERVLRGEAVESDEEWQDRRERERDAKRRADKLDAFARPIMAQLSAAFVDKPLSMLAEYSFNAAEAMLAESERRRGK